MTRFQALAASLLLTLASPLGGCVDELPAATPPAATRHVLAQGPGADAPEGAFVVDAEVGLSSQLLVGAEWFEVTFTVRASPGKAVKAYGIRTPYEQAVQPVSPRLPIAIPGGTMVLRRVHFNRVPVAGPYPLEIWMIAEDGTESNHVFTHVTVQ